MVLKLHGYDSAGYTKIPAIVLFEKEVPFEFVRVDPAAGEHKTPEYLTKQPFGQMPYLVRAPKVST
jgi:glutathione S-transferase